MSQVEYSKTATPLPAKPARRGLNIPAPVAIVLVLLMVAGATWYVYDNVFWSRTVDKSQYDISPNGSQIRGGGGGRPGFMAPRPQVVDPAAALAEVTRKLQSPIPANSGLGVLTPGNYIDIRILGARVRFTKTGATYRADFAYSDISFLPINDRGASIAKYNAIQPNNDQAKQANVTPDQVEKLKAINFPLMIVNDADRQKMIDLAVNYGAAAKDARPGLESAMVDAFREVAVNNLKGTQDAYHNAAEQVRGVLDNNQVNILRSNR